MKFVFQVRIKPGYTVEQYADAWVRASEIIQQSPGAQGTRLHRKIGSPDQLLAIASWASKSDRDAMDAHDNRRVDEIIRSAAPYVEISLIGEFEEPEWVVLPQSANMTLP